MKMKTPNLDFKEPFGSINIKSTANGLVTLLCSSESYSYEVRFETFLGLENREEFFDSGNGIKYTFEGLSLGNWNPPISYCLVEEFQGSLSTYESTLISDKTKLWVFLSMSNCVELYSNASPIVRRWKNASLSGGKVLERTMCMICEESSAHSELVALTYFSKSDDSSQEMYVHPECLVSSTGRQMMFHPDITENMDEVQI